MSALMQHVHRPCIQKRGAVRRHLHFGYDRSWAAASVCDDPIVSSQPPVGLFGHVNTAVGADRKNDRITLCGGML